MNEELSAVITLRQLRYLLALSATLSFRRGAERCGISQPSFSQQIAALEETLGFRLAERNPSGVIMTMPGREVAAIALDVLDRVSSIASIKEAGPVSGVLRLGVKATLGPYLLPPVIQSLRSTHPELRLFIREGPPIDLERELSEGLHDIILAQLPILSASIETERLFREPLYLTVAADHPLAEKETFVPTDLNGLDMLTLSPRFDLHDQVLRLCETNGANLRRDYEGTSLDALRQMVAIGLGATFLPGFYVASEVREAEDVALLRPARGDLFRSIGLAWRRGSSVAEVTAALGESVMSLVGKGRAGIVSER